MKRDTGFGAGGGRGTEIDGDDDFAEALGIDALAGFDDERLARPADGRTAGGPRNRGTARAGGERRGPASGDGDGDTPVAADPAADGDSGDQDDEGEALDLLGHGQRGALAGEPTGAADGPAAARPAGASGTGAPALVSRAFFAVAAAANAGAAVLTLALPMALDPARRLEAGALFGVLAGLSLAGLRVPARWLSRAMTGLLLGVVAVIAWAAIRLGWGLSAPGFGAYGLLVCVLCASAGLRAGATLSVAAAIGLVAGFAFGPDAAAAAGQPSELLRLGAHAVLLGGGLACGALTWRMLQRAMRAAGEREQRFRSLLALAADGYWELDPHYRLVAATRRGDDGRTAGSATLGAVPWELPRFGCDAETLDALLADLDTRLPFHDLPVRWTGASGREHQLRISGEPRFDARGRFIGYWGVARDVSADMAARQALQASEARYQELFTRTPTPLLVHRRGRVIDANPAAVQLFGYESLAAMLGRDILARYDGEAARDRARRRIDELHGQPPGAALPVTDFQLRLGERLQSVRATGVSIVVDGTPAIMSIYVDMTERRAAEEAVRRSQTMLSHLVATSPDLITLTDMETGRYAMVNHAFEQVIGYRSDEAVGRTAVELGVWAAPGERDAFIARLRAEGSVVNLPLGFCRRNGSVVSMLVSAARFVMDQREYVVINARDVTDSERASLEREAILENASIGIAVTRGQAFVLANAAFEQIFGWPRGALTGQAGRAVWLSDADYAEVGANAGPLLSRGELYETERAMRRHDGSSFVARVRGRAVDPRRPVDSGTVWIVEDITERRQFEQALARARDDAEAASRAKSAFLANTSHELRTPLNGMIGLAQLARAPETDDQRRREYLDQIAESAQSLAGIISDILDLSKIEAGKLLIEHTAFALGDLLRSLQRAYGTLADGRQLGLVFEIAPELDGMVAGDPTRVRQILGNFLSNALKFTAQGGVTVRAWRQGSDGPVHFEVQDTGPGIDAATQARLFRPFTQADESTTRRFGGTGLGLSICRELSLLMHGEIGVRSTPGRGSTFWATLPLPAAAAPAPAPHTLHPVALDGARLLLVEDNPVNMMIAAALLERWGVLVTQAQDGAQAVEAVRRAAEAGQRFDAVLMDVQMPVMSGHEATRAMRATPGGQGLPIIALTAAALVSERQEAMDAGMNDFLTKPIDADKLRATLARWVTRP